MSDRRGTPSSSQIIWLEQRVRELEAELARKSTVADAYWEIVESYRAENAALSRPAGAADEYAALRTLVKDAYNEGFNEGMREHTSSRGGKSWPDSAAKNALGRICFDCGDTSECFMNCGPVKG